MKKAVLFIVAVLTATICYANWNGGGITYTTVKADSAANASSADSLAHKKPDFAVDKMADSLAVKAPLANPTFTGIDTSAGKAVRDSVKAVKALIGGAGWRGTASKSGGLEAVTDTVTVTGLAATDFVAAGWCGSTAPTAPVRVTAATNTVYVTCVPADSAKLRSDGVWWLWIK